MLLYCGRSLFSKYILTHYRNASFGSSSPAVVDVAVDQHDGLVGNDPVEFVGLQPFQLPAGKNEKQNAECQGDELRKDNSVRQKVHGQSDDQQA